MTVRYNSRFKKLVNGDFDINRIKPCDFYSFMDKEEVIKAGDCFYFKRFAFAGNLSERINKMEFEFDTNKLRIDSIIKKNIKSIESFWCGLSFVKDLIKDLQIKYMNGFEIILSYNYEHTFITFYKIREGNNNAMSEDLENFKMEAILRIII